MLKHKRLLLVAIIAVCLLPIPARASGISDIIYLLQTITGTLKNAIGGVLSEIQSVNATINNFRQQVIWPFAEINQAKAFVSSTRAQYTGLMSQVFAIKNNSAALVNPAQLESAFRSSQPGSFGQLQPVYTNVYSAVPPPTDAQPIQRNLMDIDDALAMSSLKTTVLSDQTTQKMLALADSIEQQSTLAAPGSGPMLAAQAQVASLEAQAYQTKVLAAELRQEATRLAHDNARLKQSAQAMHNLGTQFQQVLSHQ
jgi:hypothetical protein